jgi:hypothetical protein
MTLLKIKAFVQVPITISRRYVYLKGENDRKMSKTVEIRSNLDKPLVLDPAQFNLEGKLAYTLEEVEEGRLFRVSFTSIPGSRRTYQGFLKLRTNYPEKPEIVIRIRGRFEKGNRS